MTMRTLLAVLLALAATTATARAEPSAEQQVEARQHYERGMTHYQLGEFGAAVGEFKQAYALSPAPGLLFNLGQASRLDHQYEQALYFYRTYLRLLPDAPNRADVEQRIGELQPLAEEERTQKAAQSVKAAKDAAEAAEAARAAAAPPPAVVSAPPPAATPGPSGRPLRIAGLTLGIVGVAALGTGAGLGGAALSAQSQLSKLARDMGAWSPSQADLYHRGQAEAWSATALYVVGGAALAGGVVLYLVGRHRDRARYAGTPSAGGSPSAFSLTF